MARTKNATRPVVRSRYVRAVALPKKNRKSPAKPKVKRKQYSSDRMRNAVSDVQTDVRNPTAAAKHYGVPRSSLVSTLDNDGQERQIGCKTVLGEIHEAELLKHLKLASVQGFPISVKELLEMVYEFCEAHDIPHKFNKEKKSAGTKWWRGFRKRHGAVTLRKPENLSRARALGMNRNIVAEWFDTVDRVIEQAGVKDNPELIWNVDESGLVTVPNAAGKVISFKELRNQPQIVSQERGTLTTLISACSAAGYYAPAMLVFKGKKVKDEWVEQAPPGTIVEVTDSGWSNRQMFMEYMKHFVDAMPPIPVGKKLVLILDGHGSHATLDVIKLCHENRIELLCLPPHTTNYLQPLDRCVFGPFKSAWREVCRNHIRHKKDSSGIGNIVLGDISKLYGCPSAKSATGPNAIQGFRATGLSPFDPDAVPDEAFATSDAIDEAQQEAEAATTTDAATAEVSQDDVVLNQDMLGVQNGGNGEEHPQHLELEHHVEASNHGPQQAQPLILYDYPAPSLSAPPAFGHQVPTTEPYFPEPQVQEYNECVPSALRQSLGCLNSTYVINNSYSPEYFAMAPMVGQEVVVTSSTPLPDNNIEASDNNIEASLSESPPVSRCSFADMFPKHVPTPSLRAPRVRKKLAMHLTALPPTTETDAAPSTSAVPSTSVAPLAAYNPCPVCKTVMKGTDGWIECINCHVWQHESCGGKRFSGVFAYNPCYYAAT